MKKFSLLKVNAKALTAMLALALVFGLAPSAFAQKVGDAAQVGGKNFRVAEVRGDGSLVMQPASGEYAIGDTGPGGGIIFYYSAAGFTVEMVNSRDNYTAHYLEVAPANAIIAQNGGTQSAVGVGFQWGLFDTLVSGVTTTDSATSQAANKIGNGRKDTALIVAALGSEKRIAKLCANLTYGGKNDWFLPSIGELKELYKQKNLPGIDAKNDTSWSSTQASDSKAWRMLSSGRTEAMDKGAGAFITRAIRAF